MATSVVPPAFEYRLALQIESIFSGAFGPSKDLTEPCRDEHRCDPDAPCGADLGSVRCDWCSI